MNRNGLKVMYKLIGLVLPLVHVMIAAITMGVIGFLTAIFIIVLGGVGLLNILGFATALSLKQVIIGIVICAVLRGILRYAEQGSNHYIAFKLLALIRHKVFIKLRKLAPAKLEGKDKGNLISIITTDTELLEVFYAHTISPIIIAFITSVIMTIFIGSYNIFLGAIALVAYFIVGVIIPVWSSNQGDETGQQYRDELGDLNSYFLSSIRGINDIIQYGVGKERLDEINRRTDELETKQKFLLKQEGSNRAVTDTAILLCSMVMLFAGCILYNKGQVDFTQVIIPLIALMSSFGPVVAISNLSNNLFHTIAAGNRVLDLLEEEPAVEEVSGKETVEFADMKLENVSFAYDDEVILEDFNMEIKKNTIIGIYGKSGCGKSTLLKLLMRFWEVNNGAITIGGKNINEINTSDLRKMQSFVTQDTYLFNDTIANNIGIAKENATMEEIIAAAKKASIHDFIMSLPKGYDSKVGELGGNLSGGEKQRIGIARAFLHDAPMILLDEPTSNLDSLNEGIILKSLMESKENKTIIIVSHRKSTMNIADVVLDVEKNSLQGKSRAS
ncbi:MULTISPECIES: amino acid ABC transporter ATP-binding/permease protein [unclassified Clostridium]|jgi:ATP-binding cassette subfamily C protein|uniref:amino acid ABC transporter ATP-binding/permease protein n=1 Tax=unclassified Clostridium TaxID=2614128 RepID=UPI0009632E0C|nr:MULTISPECIES: ABC transporter ATP-binding protein [unclassified Clostridium]MEE0568053.1 ABC transporter ATP-binding protein [Clostridium sp.]OKZ87957.1 MAG: ABC transporter ATP-binding protein [Clostridium sp. 29_15]